MILLYLEFLNKKEEIRERQGKKINEIKKCWRLNDNLVSVQLGN